MTMIGQFIQEIQKDFQIVISRKDSTSKIRDQRMASLAVRVLGLALIALSLFNLVTGILAVGGSTGGAVYLAFSNVVFFVTGHDFIVVGVNKGKAIPRAALETDEESNLSPKISSQVKKGFQAIQEAIRGNDLQSICPLQGTWIFEPLFTCRVF